MNNFNFYGSISGNVVFGDNHGDMSSTNVQNGHNVTNQIKEIEHILDQLRHLVPDSEKEIFNKEAHTISNEASKEKPDLSLINKALSALKGLVKIAEWGNTLTKLAKLFGLAMD